MHWCAHSGSHWQCAVCICLPCLKQRISQRHNQQMSETNARSKQPSVLWMPANLPHLICRDLNCKSQHAEMQNCACCIKNYISDLVIVSHLSRSVYMQVWVEVRQGSVHLHVSFTCCPTRALIANLRQALWQCGGSSFEYHKQTAIRARWIKVGQNAFHLPNSHLWPNGLHNRLSSWQRKMQVVCQILQWNRGITAIGAIGN